MEPLSGLSAFHAGTCTLIPVEQLSAHRESHLLLCVSQDHRLLKRLNHQGALLPSIESIRSALASLGGGPVGEAQSTLVDQPAAETPQ
jgi:hypothetical protein